MEGWARRGVSEHDQGMEKNGGNGSGVRQVVGGRPGRGDVSGGRLGRESQGGRNKMFRYTGLGKIRRASSTQVIWMNRRAAFSNC